MSGLWWDLQTARQALRRSPGFTLLAAGILALGIGASTTIFSAIDGVLLRPLPYDQPDRLVALGEFNSAQSIRAGVSAPTYLEWKTSADALEQVAAYRPWGFVLTGRGTPERLIGARVSSNLFPMLGIAPVLGRSFAADDELPGAPRSVVLSEGLWRRRFGADSSLLGSSIRLDGAPVTVVGVLPAGFDLPAADLWVPLSFAPYELDQRGNRALTVIGRVRPRIELTAVRSELEAIGRTLAQRYPEASGGWQPRVSTLRQELVGDTRGPLLLLFGATLALMLVATANLGNLLLVRSIIRLKEMALRAALGAQRSRLARQLLAENLLLVAFAAALGTVVAVLGTGLLGQFAPPALMRTATIEVNRASILFATGLAVLAGLVLGLIPILRLSRIDLGVALKLADGKPVAARRFSPGDVLVVGQVAVALVLLVGGGLLARSLARVQAVEPGFDPRGVTSLTVSLPSSRYPAAEQRLQFYADLIERVRSEPGAQAVGLASHLPLGASPLMADFVPADRPGTTAGETPRAQLSVVTPGYLEAAGIQLLKGRELEPSDRAGAPAVALVDAVLAQRTWPDQDPIGQRIRVGAALGADTAPREVVGVVAPVRSLGLEREPEPMIYLPHAQNPWPTMNLVIRIDERADRVGPRISAQVQALDPEQPVNGVRSLEELLDRDLALRRFQTVLLGGFALSALVLAVLGVYGILSFNVARRTRELGIRAALGATREAIMGSVLRQALTRIVLGCMLGSVAALAAGRLLQSVLYRVSPADPLSFLGAGGLLVLCGLLAAGLPASRAMGVDPVEVLRRE